MSRASDARRQNRKARRAMDRAGVALVDRVSIDGAALAAGASNGGDVVELIAYQVAEGLGRLDRGGADIIHGTTAITIGSHPDYPGALTIELKAGKLKSEPVENDIAIAPADEADLDDSDDGLLASS